MKGDEVVNFPWNHDNIDQWLYRPVKITGRQVHKHTMFPRGSRHGFPGADYILPIVTREDADWSTTSREGILVNKGWIPAMNISKSLGIIPTQIPTTDSESRMPETRSNSSDM